VDLEVSYCLIFIVNSAFNSIIVLKEIETYNLSFDVHGHFIDISVALYIIRP